MAKIASFMTLSVILIAAFAPAAYTVAAIA